MILSSMQSSSPFSQIPSTPSRSSYYSARSHRSHQPLNSSPLASPSMSSPTSAAQERRRSQYKSAAPRTQTSYRTPETTAKLLFSKSVSEDPQKTFLRERFQARCRERAQRQREKAVNSRRSSDAFSDEFMDCDEEESDEAIMQDELFRRIMQSTSHKKKHSYRLSYSLEVGSSFDPDMEEASTWERELQYSAPSSAEAEPSPEELEEEELMEYAERCAILADFADLDVAAEDFSAWSDIEDMPPDSSQETLKGQKTHQDSDMDMS
ncbi:hypothetical protein HYDPIDRAFT_112790 [Hydnomerulius pinastri MD-312]|uniref:Uncharacterized protein n=1 Tax=Hydnomerulius pinastri MD-312 TaxID=994086 RepID=A0A0C9VZF4_9AGAM|nr:hypothetical protein HYDPIDRAFT_112790 [Hydnomerulius pinastri MD-312]